MSADGAGDAGRVRRIVERPYGYHVEKGGGQLTIRRKWSTDVPYPLFLFLGVLAALVDGAALNMVFGMLTGGWPGAMTLLVGLGGVGIVLFFAVLLGWFFACFWLNAEVIVANSREIRWSYGPVRVPRLVDVSAYTGDVEQVFCKPDESPDSRRMAVWLRLKNGEDVQLFSVRGEPEIALFIEQEIQECLGMDDAPVEGEYIG